MKKKKRARRGAAPRIVVLLILLLLIGLAVRLALGLLGIVGGSPQAGQTPAQAQPTPTAAVTAAPTQTPKPTPTPAPTAPPVSPEEALYQQVYGQVDRLESPVRFTASGMTQEQVTGVLDLIQRDPEFFWLDGYTYYVTGADYEVTYNWKYADPDPLRRQVEAAADQALASIPAGAGDYEIALALHDWLCQHIVYQYSTDGSDQDLYGALVLGRCVCAGYSKSYEYLLGLAGVQAETVRGEADNGTTVESHAWTKLVLEGEVYYTDVTWDDQEDAPDGCSYGWFAVTSARMASTHFPDPTLGADMTPSTATACNYYYRNGWMLERFDTRRLEEILSSQAGDRLTVMAADQQTYRQLIELVGNGDELFPLLERAGHPSSGCTYQTNEDAMYVDISLNG